MFRFFARLCDPFASSAGTPPADVLRFILIAIRPLYPVIAASLVLAAIGAGIEVWMIFYAGRLVDLLAASSPAGLWEAHGGELLLAAALVLVARPLAGFLRESLDDIAFRPNAETLVLWRAHRHLLRQSVGWFRSRLAGHSVAMLQAAGASATGAAYSVVHILAYVAFYVAGSLLLMASVDLRLVLPLLGWVILYFGLMAYVVPRYRRATARFQEANSTFTGRLVDSYSNIDTVKLFANQAAEDREARSQLDARRQGFFAVQRLEVTINATMLLLGSVLVVALIGYAIWLWQSGAAPVGIVATALALSLRITTMAEWLLDGVAALFGHIGALREALRTVSQPIELVDALGAPALRPGPGAIAFSGVAQRYGQATGGVHDIDLAIAGGEKVGIVGRSGAGKSTLVNLLLRFFDPEAGRISIDGQDIGTVTQESLRRQVTMVTQEAALLHRSIRANIAYGQDAADFAAITQAARQAEADGFIAGLADAGGNRGYEAVVGERGVTLSGGQRQRIALARALLKDAPILILDEATSALDSEVEAAIQHTLYGMMEGRTVIAIAHRLSTIARMDRIVVLDDGTIVEQGTHEALLAAGGVYALLWAHQSGGFLGS